MRENGIKPEEIKLLSSKSLRTFEALSDLQSLALAFTDLQKISQSGVILLDGLEYLVSQFGFDMVYRFIQQKRFDILEKDCLLLMPVNMDTFSAKEQALLMSELKLVKVNIFSLCLAPPK